MTVKSKILEVLELHRGETLSGEKLAQELHCTRAAIWKAVKTLREEGYQIEAGSNRGYRLSSENDRLSAEAVRLYLAFPDVEFIVLDHTESTNQEAKRLAVEGKLSHGSFVLANAQSRGRGRRGRKFYSPEGSGLYISVVLQPRADVRDSLLITTAAAAAVYKAVKKVCGISLDIKWVNDLYRNGKKVGGILTEAITDFESGTIEYAIAGIGLNLYLEEKMPDELKGIAGGIFDSIGEAVKVNRNLLAAEIVNAVLEETKEGKLSENYVTRNIIPGHWIRIEDGDKCRQAEALSICEDGRLLIREQDGSLCRLSYGEVSVVLENEDGCK